MLKKSEKFITVAKARRTRPVTHRLCAQSLIRTPCMHNGQLCSYPVYLKPTTNPPSTSLNHSNTVSHPSSIYVHPSPSATTGPVSQYTWNILFIFCPYHSVSVTHRNDCNDDTGLEKSANLRRDLAYTTAAQHANSTSITDSNKWAPIHVYRSVNNCWCVLMYMHTQKAWTGGIAGIAPIAHRQSQ